MKVVRPNDPEYNADRQICNARFDYRPLAIYYCENAGDVSSVIKGARASGDAVRIRSGGHQHEGMCTANGVRLIDLSFINKVENREAGFVWIGAGAVLKYVYAALWQQGYLFSGGGCNDVHVGGLTQGGGWGPVSRKYGLTCDSLVGVEMVTAKGDIIVISQDGGADDRELLWALRGGGGGNFGVITKFHFRLLRYRQEYTGVTLTWGDHDLPGDQLDRFVSNWIQLFPGDKDDNLTTFLRLSVVDEPGGDRAMVGGRYLGGKAQAQETMNRLLANQPAPRKADYEASPPQDPTIAADTAEWELLSRTLGTLRGYQPGPALIDEGLTAAGAQADLSETCSGTPLRHKISSGFARPQFDQTAVAHLTSFIRTSDVQRTARQYVSLHSLGGAIVKNGDHSAFAFRDRHFLLQYQAWWQPQAVDLDRPCIAWIENFRRAMAPHTDGAFINFVDRDIAVHEYYKGHLQHLSHVRRHWDPDDFFRFEMSIPLK